MLPIINLNPMSERRIYPTLLFLIKQSKWLGIVTPHVTFDKQLCIITLEIIAANQFNLILLLGGSHMFMSF